MKPYTITFNINNQSKIIIPLKKSLSSTGWHCVAPILFSHNGDTITVADAPIYLDMIDLQNCLKNVLNNTLVLSASAVTDIGHLFNKHGKKLKDSLSHKKNNYDNKWCGEKYRIWYAYTNKKVYITTLYNDHEGNIIFKIVPYYPYFFCNKKKEPNYVSFRKWIKNYKPYFTTRISRKTAQQWLEQTDYIVKTINDNVIRWKKEHEE